jgi:hypothetical protein
MIKFVTKQVAGRLCIYNDKDCPRSEFYGFRKTWSIHLLPRKDYRCWGLIEEPRRDGTIYQWGLGPFLLVAWIGG